jgi:hypothetical protein
VSGMWQAAMRRLGIQYFITTAYHPQSNRVTERAHRRLKEALKARLAASEWPEYLPWALLGIRATRCIDSGM